MIKHFTSLLLCITAIITSAALDTYAQHLVILHTNDTHSQIDPLADGRGGILRRKVLIDSIRRNNDNVILVDAGDVVQGSLYFSIYKGRVEREMLNALGYEICILGNHEFDNGMDKLAEEWSQLNAELINTNYVLDGTPLKSLFKPWVIKEYNGKKVGFIGINIDPKGMISPERSRGVIYHDAITSANTAAGYLRDSLNADFVVAITHIGYNSKSPVTPSDSMLAVNSRGIDVIIGGHSHTHLNEYVSSKRMHLNNADGKEILVTQAGSLGTELGRIDIDLNEKTAASHLLPIDKRYDDQIDHILDTQLRQYSAGIIDKVNEILAYSPCEIIRGSSLHCNWIADAAHSIASSLDDSCPIDVTIVNRGGLRHGLQQGPVTVGMIMTMLPFDNHIVLLDIAGKDLIDSFKIITDRGGDAISSGFDIKSIDSNKNYRIATIDYLAHGGDYMAPLTKGTIVKCDTLRFDNAVINWLRNQTTDQLQLPETASRF